MPLYISDYTDEKGGWAVWKVTETEEELRILLPLSGIYLSELAQFKAAPKRMKERLAVRVLMYTLWKQEYEVEYDETGKPSLKGHPFEISISHTLNYVAVCWHPSSKTAIDIERLTPKALKLRSRFVRTDERAEGDELNAAVFFWSAKETLYKVLSVQNGVNFIADLYIAPLVLAKKGNMYGTDLRNPEEEYLMHYLFTEDFVLTWYCPS